jgi:RNA polymerase sigma-70 factor (ECF subfamily)
LGIAVRSKESQIASGYHRERASRGSSDGIDSPTTRAAAQFATTHWSIVLTAADSGSPGAREALENLCQTYWYPLYAFVRLKGNPPEDAKDLTQAFFERFLQKHCVKNFCPQKGRFRTYLLVILQRFLCDEFDRSIAVKRGGGVPNISLDTAGAEALLGQAVASRESPESAFERAWAEVVVQTSFEQLRKQCDAEGKSALFHELSAYLSRPADRTAYTASGARLGLSPDAVAMAVMRLRKQYRAIVRAEVANTVATPAEIDDELRHLVELLTGSG